MTFHDGGDAITWSA